MRKGSVVALAGALLFGGCGGGDSGSSPTPTVATPPPAATQAVVSVEITPTSPVAQPTGDATYPWRVDWTVVLHETAGLGGNVNFVNVGFVNSFGFEAPGVLNYGASEVVDHAGTNHLAARGQLQIPLSMIYRADGFGGRTITLKNTVDFTDDRGHNMKLGATATVVSVGAVRF